MAVKINSISFANEFRGETTDYLLGAIGDKIVAAIDCTAEWILESDVSKEPYFTTGNKVYWVSRGGGASDYSGENWEQAGFKVGDAINVFNASVPFNHNRNITEISADGLTMTYDGASIGSGGLFAGETIFTGLTECTGVNFKYNLIENQDSPNYLSLVDQNELKYSKANIDYTNLSNVSMIQQGIYSSNSLGDVVVRGTGTLNRFIITHTFYITPLFLIDQINSNGLTVPDYFNDLNCLNYIYNIELLYVLNDPNRKHVTSEDSFLIGNTGWFNENFNKGKNYYSIESTIFKVGGNTISYADFTQPTDFSIVINSVNGTFVNLSTLFTINHFLIPDADDDYINTSTDFTTNFMFDRAIRAVGAVPTNGDGFGTQKQVLKNVSATFLNASSIRINGTIDLSSSYKLRVEDSDNRQLVLFVTTQNQSLATEDSDKVALFKELRIYDQDLSNPNAGSLTTEFISHLETSISGTTTPDSGWFVEDWQIGKSNFSVDLTNNAVIKNVAVKILATHSTYGSFNLETKQFSTSSAPVVLGIQDINIVESAGFKMASGNIFNEISLKRKASLDSGNNKFYELLYPFKIRWEDFIALAPVSSQFYNPSLPNNGFNQDWARYYASSGWSIIYRVQVTIEENGVNNIIQSDSSVIANDYDDATDWTGVIQSFDFVTSAVITGNVLLDAKTTIKGVFTKTSGTPPVIGDVEGVLGVAPKDAGGTKIIREISTVHIHENDSPWISINGDKLLDKVKVSNVYTFEAVIDNNKLVALFPNYKEFDFTGRIYELPLPSVVSKQFEDNDDFEFEDGNPYEFE